MSVESATVRLWGTATPVGGGWLVDSRHVITCAHVVDAALGRSREVARDAPREAVSVDFLAQADGGRETRWAARVIAWRAAGACGAGDVGEGDLALLELVDPSDLPAETLPLGQVTAGELWDHSFRVIGFPAGHPTGRSATGQLRGRNALGWVELVDTQETGIRVQPGFSGCPVWDVNAGGIAGILVASERSVSEKAAWLIPAERLRDFYPALELVDQLTTISSQQVRTIASAEQSRSSSDIFTAISRPDAWHRVHPGPITGVCWHPQRDELVVGHVEEVVCRAVDGSLTYTLLSRHGLTYEYREFQEIRVGAGVVDDVVCSGSNEIAVHAGKFSYLIPLNDESPPLSYDHRRWGPLRLDRPDPPRWNCDALSDGGRYIAYYDYYATTCSLKVGVVPLQIASILAGKTSDVAFLSGDGTRLIAGIRDGVDLLRIVDIVDGSLREDSLRGGPTIYNHPADRIFVSRDKRTLCVCCFAPGLGRWVATWTVEQDADPALHPKHELFWPNVDKAEDAVDDLAVSPGGRVVVLAVHPPPTSKFNLRNLVIGRRGQSHLLLVWDTETGRHDVVTLPIPFDDTEPRHCLSAEFSPSGEYLAVGSPHGLWICRFV
jgi:Trypsin-like peptidase domain